jgi:N-sulfoglucosamine sulfohydrolase
MPPLFAAILAFMVLVLGTATARSAPNILVITADDLGLQLGCYGDGAIRTPHVDALARRGRLFDRAYVTQASCSPSRSAMFTGLYPHANGQYGLLNAGVGFELHPPLRGQTMPALLQQGGYRTGILGKLHVGPENCFPFDSRIRVDTRDVQAVAREARTFFAGTEPFFLMANYSDPHVIGRRPRPPAEAFATQYLGVPSHPLAAGQAPPFPFQRIDTPEQRERISQYYNAVMRFDAGVGLLMAALEEAGQTDNTVVLLIGDHGPPFARGKTSCYEAGVRVPLLVVWPGVFAAGERCHAFASSVDLLPTVLDAAGLSSPANLHGRSLRLTSDPARSRTYLATEFHYHGASPFFPRRSIRGDRFKLIHNLRAGQLRAPESIDGDAAFAMSQQDPVSETVVGAAFRRLVNPPEYELYDLTADPWEFSDLAGDSAHADSLAELKEALLDWRRETADPLLTPEGLATMAAFEKP